MTDPLGQSQVIPYLAGLQKAGYQITILSCEKEAAYNLKKDSIKSLLHESGLQWYPLMYTKKPPVLSTLWDVIKLRRAAAAIHKKNKVAMVHTRPGIPSMVGYWFKKKYGAFFLNDIREFYADSRVDGGMWNLDSPLYKRIYNYFKAGEAKQVAQSDGIVCLTYAAKKIIKSWPEYKPDIPLQVIPCSVDTNLFNAGNISSAEKERTAQKLGIAPDTQLFTYLGSIGGWYLTDEMMRLCKIIADKIPSSKFLFISPHEHETIAAAAQRQGLPSNRLITTHANRNEIPLLLSLSDYSIFFIKPCYSKQSSSPTKHGELMAMGIPVITNSGVGDVAEIVEKYNDGYVLTDFNDKAYEEIADNISARPSFDRERIREGALEFYSLNEAVKKYISIYQSILKS
ncbi:MAG: glycosyltransferase [Ferruginibacter sp.]